MTWQRRVQQVQIWLFFAFWLLLSVLIFLER